MINNIESFTEKLSNTVIDLMQELHKQREEISKLQRDVLEVKDICRSCACFQQDDFK